MRRHRNDETLMDRYNAEEDDIKWAHVENDALHIGKKSLLNLAPMMAGRWPSRAERNRRNPTQYKGLYKMDDNSVMAVAF